MKVQKSKMVTIEIPIGVFAALKQTTDEFAISLRANSRCGKMV